MGTADIVIAQYHGFDHMALKTVYDVCLDCCTVANVLCWYETKNSKRENMNGTFIFMSIINHPNIRYDSLKIDEQMYSVSNNLKFL
ncbi:MAG: hypothetical protein JSV84_14500 [Gemmatimonadota bacterium]|nr:MAG: hypothetical protein JSV84_14500 [Gemmatimonadota bacterium]